MIPGREHRRMQASKRCIELRHARVDRSFHRPGASNPRSAGAVAVVGAAAVAPAESAVIIAAAAENTVVDESNAATALKVVGACGLNYCDC